MIKTLVILVFIVWSSMTTASAEESRADSGPSSDEFALFQKTNEEGPTADYVTNMERSYEYLKAFPNGEHAGRVHANLGYLHADILKVLIGIREGYAEGYKYECYSKYVTTEELTVQMSRARSASIRHIEEALALISDEEERKFLTSYLEDFDYGRIPYAWVGCTD